MTYLTTEELDKYIVEYIEKKNSSLGISASNILRFSDNGMTTDAKLKGRLRALSNRKMIIKFKKSYTTADDEIGYVNVYFPKKQIEVKSND